MSIEVLGPVAVAGTGSVSPRDRVVLAVLVVRKGEVVSPDQLADALWRGEPPESWKKVVQSTIVRLRKRLGPGAVETTPVGYRLVVGEDDVDASRFERLVERAVELVDRGEHDRAVDALERSLALWRGEPFADVDGWDPGAVEASRLVELRRLAEEHLIDARLVLGEHGDAVGHARVLVAAEPLRERRWALLALALYRAGRQGEALRALHEARRVLADQLGVDPGTDLVALEAAVLAQDPAIASPSDGHRHSVSTQCPYKGLAPFAEDDRDRFFGRDTDVSACRRRLADVGALAVVGASGSGKSSLVRAGLVPALRAEGRSVAVLTPGIDPAAALATALAAVGGDVVAVVDQAEELFTVCTDRDRRVRFAAALAAHAERQPVVLVLRADHVGAVAAHTELARFVEAGLYLLGPMDEVGVRAAIEGPSRQAGLRLEHGLVELLVRDVLGQPGALPLLSHALVETWSRREGRVLTVAGYLDSGGVQGAVARTAEAVYASFPDPDRRVARSLFLRLVSTGDDGEAVRHRLTRSALAGDHAVVADTLVRARLLIAHAGSLEIAHEALARAWPRLRRWLDEDREGLRILSHLAGAAEDWATRDHDDTELYRGDRLRAAVVWAGDTGLALSPTEQAFITASSAAAEQEQADAVERLRRQRRANRRLRGLLAAVAVALVAAIVAGVVAVDQRQQVVESREAADAGRLAAQARLEVDDDLSRALLLAVEGNRLEDNATTRGSLQASLLHDPQVSGFLPADGDGVAFAAVSPDGSRVAVGGSGGTVRVWDPRAGSPVGDPFVVGSSVRSVEFGADDRLLAAAGTDGSVALFDVASGRPRWKTSVEGRPWDVALSPDGEILAVSSTAGGRGQVTLFGLDRPESPLGRLTDERPLNGLAFSPDGRLLVAGAGDPTLLSDPTAGVVVFDVATRAPLARPSAHSQGVAAVAFSSDGRRFATASTDETALIWDAASLTPIGSPLRDTRINGNHLLAVAFSDDGRRLATGGSEVTVWDVDTAQPVGPVLDPQGGGVVSSIDWTPDGERLIGATANGKVVLWETSGRPALGTLVPGVGTDGGLLSPDGRWVAALGAGSQPPPSPGTPQTVTVVDTVTGQPVGPSLGTATSIAFGSGRDGAVVAMVRDDGSLSVVEAASGRTVFTSSDQTVPISGVAFSRDGATVAAGRFDGSVVLVDAVSGEVRGAPLTGHEGLVPWIAFQPDGAAMLTASIGGGALAWDLTRSPPVPRRLSDEQSLRTLGLSFSPDGRLVAAGSADGRVALWDGRTLEPSGPPTVGSGVVAPVGFTADGAVLATSGDDGTVRLYDVASGQQIGVPFPKGSVYGSASLSADGRLLVTGSPSGLVMWDTDPAAWVRHACAAAGRNLTRAEWERFLPDNEYRTTCPQWPAA